MVWGLKLFLFSCPLPCVTTLPNDPRPVEPGGGERPISPRHFSSPFRLRRVCTGVLVQVRWVRVVQCLVRPPFIVLTEPLGHPSAQFQSVKVVPQINVLELHVPPQPFDHPVVCPSTAPCRPCSPSLPPTPPPPGTRRSWTATLDPCSRSLAPVARLHARSLARRRGVAIVKCGDVTPGGGAGAVACALSALR